VSARALRPALLTDVDYCESEETEIPEISVELSMLDKLKYRVQLAKKIEIAQHKVKKTKHDRNWMKETADVLGVELDSDFVRYVLPSILLLILTILHSHNCPVTPRMRTNLLTKSGKPKIVKWRL